MVSRGLMRVISEGMMPEVDRILYERSRGPCLGLVRSMETSHKRGTRTRISLKSGPQP
jgi:hypothetical protein